MLDDLLSLNANVSALFGFSIVGGISLLGKSLLKAYKQNKATDNEKFINIATEIDVLKESSRAILHGQLFDLCISYINKGYIKPVELRNINYLYKSYRDLKGNGTIEMLMNDVSRLPIKEGGNYDNEKH